MESDNTESGLLLLKQHKGAELATSTLDYLEKSVVFSDVMFKQ